MERGWGSISAPKFTCGVVVLTHVPENARFCCGAKSRRVHELGGTPFGARIAQRLLGLCCPEGCNAEQATMRFSTTPSIPPKDSPEMHYVPVGLLRKIQTLFNSGGSREVDCASPVETAYDSSCSYICGSDGGCHHYQL